MADIELLPLYAELQGHPKIEIIKHYARVNVERHTEKLRADVERWERAFKDNYLAEKARAERLEAALRVLLPFADHADSCGDHDAYNQAAVRTCVCGLDSFRDQAEAALRDHEQEAPQ